MFQSLPNPIPESNTADARNPWAIVDLVVFGLFSLLATLGLLLVFTQLPLIYAIPVQAVFNLVLVGFIAGWVRIVRHSTFREYVQFFRSKTFSTRWLIALGTGLAVAVLII